MGDKTTSKLQGFLILFMIMNCVEANSTDFEDCHRVGKSKYNSKKVIARFVNQKIIKNALYKRKQLKTIDRS